MHKLLKAAHDCYKLLFDKVFRSWAPFVAEQYVYVEKLPGAVLSSEAEKVATECYNKLLSKVSGVYKIVTVRDTTMTVLEDAIGNRLSSERTTKASGLQ